MMTTREKPKTLEQARNTLRSLGVSEMPRTLAKANDKIEEVTGAKFQQPALTGNAIARAREYLGPDNPAAKQTADPLDMTQEQLHAAISAERDPVKRKALFNVLNEREGGRPRRSIIEQARDLTDLELEKRIEDTRDPVERGELFSILTSRRS